MNIQQIDISKINEAYYNPRVRLTPSDDAYKKIKRSLEEFQCVEPIVVNSVNMRCVGGHQRLQVMRDMGYKEVPCSFVEIEDEAKEKSLNLALNKISGEFDYSKLETVLSDLENVNYDISITGFNEREIDDILAEVDIEADEFQGIEEVEAAEADVMCKIGNVSFKVRRETYLSVINEIRMRCGFDDESIIKELKRRILDDSDC